MLTIEMKACNYNSELLFYTHHLQSLHMHFLLIYDVSKDYSIRRSEFRNEHLKLAWESVERGELILGGAVENPLDTAILLFKGDSPYVAERFAEADPYVLNKLVKSWRVREWKTVVGELSDNPIRPTE